MSDTTNIEKIDRYLLGEMTQQERIDFESFMEENPDLKETMLIQKHIVSAIDAVEKEKFIQHLKEIDKSKMVQVVMEDSMHYKKMEKAIKLESKEINWKKYALSAIAIAAMFVVVFLVFKNSNSTNYDRLYAENFTTYPNDYVFSRSDDLTQEDQEIITEALQYYDNKEYSQTIQVLEKYLTAKDKDTELLFYLAMSQMEIGKIEEAIENLEYLNAVPDYLYSVDVKWYLALGYLKKGEGEKAKSLLEELRDIPNNYSFKINALINILK
jgi:tetratricopeptide (TPR) repeat protein